MATTQSATDLADGFRGESVIVRLTNQATWNPDRPALVAGSNILTYGELDSRATQLAARLAEHGAGAEVVVGICLPRSQGFVVAALAVMKCGAAYLPLDPANPSERLCFIVNDAAIPLLITAPEFTRHFESTQAKILTLDQQTRPTREFVAAEPQPDLLAYVIYTSGSTGTPKGVEITHGGLTNLVDWHLRAFGVDRETRATFQASVGFDAAVWEIWPALAAGATLYLPPDCVRLAPDALRDWIVANQITISFVPTAIAELLINLPWPRDCALRFLLTGADTLHRHPPSGLPFTLVNNYGPTECTVVTTSGPVSPGNADQPTIGKPIDGVYVHILDEELRALADGVVGEICVGGAGVARGYRNSPQLTAEKFIADPIRGETSRIYRTGDRGCRLANGEIAFLGRADDQVKIRGNRIELGEIAAVLDSHPAVQSACVIVRDDQSGEKRLVAYVVPRNGVRPDEQNLRAAVRHRLPVYMEPSAFVWLESLPLTANGKVDRAALAAPQSADSSLAFVAPTTEVEITLAAIVSDVLKVPRVGLHDDFFHLGGHSLLGAQLIGRVRSAFGVELKLLDVFDAPTVAELSTRIEAAFVSQLSAMSDAEVEAALAAFEAKTAIAAN